MTSVEVEEIAREENTFIRSCEIKINGSKVLTPTRTVSLTKSNILELKVASPMIGKDYRPLGEVYTKISLSDLSQLRYDNEKFKEFNTVISNRLTSLKNSGAVPYLVLSITEDNGNPVNRLLPDDILEFIFNILWGSDGNRIIVPPLMGLLPDTGSYDKLISSLNERCEACIERKNLPIMALIPPPYNLIEPKLLDKYWNIGCRLFAFDFENKKYGAYGPMIEKAQINLDSLSKQSGEKYALNALNSKFKIGKKDTSRINNLLGSGFGFDIYSPNHIIKGFPPQDPIDYPLFNSEDYGFKNLSSVSNGSSECENILKSESFKSVDLDFSNSSSYQLRNLASKFNLEASIKEVKKYPTYIQENNLSKYLSEKDKIKGDIAIMRKITQKTYSPKTDSVDEWL